MTSQNDDEILNISQNLSDIIDADNSVSLGKYTE